MLRACGRYWFSADDGELSPCGQGYGPWFLKGPTNVAIEHCGVLVQGDSDAHPVWFLGVGPPLWPVVVELVECASSNRGAAARGELCFP